MNKVIPCILGYMLTLKYTTSPISSSGIIYAVDFDIFAERLAGILITYAVK